MFTRLFILRLRYNNREDGLEYSVVLRCQGGAKNYFSNLDDDEGAKVFLPLVS